jgi:hypothetical protein
MRADLVQDDREHEQDRDRQEEARGYLHDALQIDTPP